MAGADDDEDWDSDFGIEPNINTSLQRKLTIGHLSKKKSSHQLVSASPSNSSTSLHSNNVLGVAGAATPPINSGNSDFSGFDDDDDDDDWGKTSSPSKSIIENRKEEDENEDWDSDFGISGAVGGPLAHLLSGNSNNNNSSVGNSATASPSIHSAAPQMKILGIRADPTAKAEWDDDFLFNDSSESDNNKSLLTPAGNILARARSGPSVLVSDAKLSNSIFELFQLLNFGNDVDLSDKQIVESKTPPINSLKICSESELKKKIDNQLQLIEIANLKESKLDLSKKYYELGMIYQQNQQTLNASNQFTTANKILQEYKDDFDTPIDEDNDEHELNLLYQLGVTSKAMANIFNTTEYLKKALDISQSDLKRFTSMHQKINMELGVCYQTTETPIYATKFFENLIRSILFAQCKNSAQHQHSKECGVDIAKIGDWSGMASACLQMGKTLKILNEFELALQFIKKAYSSMKRGSLTDRAMENECILLYGDINRLIILHQNQDKATALATNKANEDASTIKDFESEEEEDWDAELGLDAEEDSRPILQLAGQSPTVAPNKDRMPSHYKLIDSINNQTFEIVKYPKPSYLYSLTTPEGHLFLHEEALSKWLSSLIVKHLNGEDRALRVLPQKASLEELRNDFALGTSKYKKNTKKWAQLNLEFCYTMHIFGHDEQCWETIQSFFLDLRDSGTASPLSASRTKLSSGNLHSSPIGGKNRLSMEIDEKDATYHYAMQMLYLAAKLWKPEEDSSFKHMFQGLRNISVTNSPHVDLLVAETYSHHLHHKPIEDSDNDTNSDYTDSDEEPELRTRPDEFSGNEEEKINPLNVFLRIYQQCRIRQQQEASTLNPNNNNSKANAAKEYLEIGTKNAMVRALVDIHFHLNGISPLTSKRLGEPFLDVNVNSQMADLLDVNHRMKLLTDLYLEIPTTFLKAKAAYALGLNAVDSGDLVLAEKFFFECLYIIDKCKQPVVGLPLVLSELAANASIGYAGVLLDNYKYQYAIVAFDNALLVYNIRKKKEYNTLLRRVAALARENDDINSAIYYYKQILNNYLDDDPQSKTNEIVYICDVISTLYWEKGSYKQSEEYLKVVFLILQKSSSPIHESALSLNKMEAPKFDNPIFFQLHLKLANLYLESYHFEKGLELLSTIRKHQLPHGKLNSLLFLMAKAYTKLEWYDHCTTALNLLENEDTNPTSFSAINRSNPLRSSAPPKAPFHNSAGGSGNNKTERNLKYWELNCINYLHANKFPEALVCIECAIEICPSSSLNARGQYFYIRGKIFQKLVSFSNATLITFPTTLKPTADEWKEFVDLSQPTTNYTCTGDLIQEGIASFKRAYNYFKSIGDDVRIQKTVSRIAETYLDRVFGPVALLHYQFDDVARLPNFIPSRFIQKDGELYQDDKNKRQKKKDEPAPAKSPGSPPLVEKEFYISFEIIENPAILAMDINIDTCNVIQLLRNYMNMAELRYLQGDRDLAISYWTECRNLYITMFCDGPHLIGKSAPLFFLKKLFTTCKRMIRFMFAFDQEFINKNLMLVDSYLSLEIDISQARKRHIELNKPLSYESNPQISKIYMPYLGKSYTLGRNFRKKTEMSGALSMDNIPTNPVTSNINLSNGSDGENKLSTLTFNEKTKDEEKSVSTGDEVGEKIWGSLHAINNEIRKYSIGKITQEELCTRCKLTIKQILKIQQSYKNHLANQHAGSPSNYPVPLQTSNSLGSLFRSQTKMNLNAMANGTDSIGRARTPSNAEKSGWGTVRNLSSKYEELSFSAAQAKINASLQKLVYSLQVDNYFIHYVPHTGRKRFNRIGGVEELTPMPPPTNMLYLEIYLLSNANEKVSFVVSPLITLEKLLLFLCNKPYWAVDNSDSKKKGFFGSFSRATNNSFKSTPKFVEKTTNFHNELISFLNSTIGVPGTDEDTHISGSDSPPQERAADKQDHHHHAHTPTLNSTSPPHNNHAVHHQHINTHPNLPSINITQANQQHNQDIHGRSMSVGSSTPRKVYSHQQLSLISFTKRMIKSDDPAYAKAYVSFDQLSYQICKVFSHREMRECSEQNPLQLSLFVNNGEEKKSQTNLDAQTTTKSAPTNDQAITFTPEILSSFLPLLSLAPSKDPIQEEADRKKIISELKHTTFSSLFEILPTEKPDSHSIKPLSNSAGNKKQSKTFVFFGSSKDVTSVTTMPTSNISTTPLIFICSKSLQVFPWELIIPDFMVRYLTLYDLMRTGYIDTTDPENQENGIIPCFISCCNSVIDKAHYNDPTKKDQQVKSVLYNLYTNINKNTARVLNENQPYLSPLIKLGVKPKEAKKKYKYLDFFDVATNKVSGVVHFLESFDDSIHFPVFIFAYNDIVDLSQLPIFILRSKPICNVLFIPYSKQKDIMSRLFKIYDTHLKQNVKNSNPPTRKERYQFFISTVQSLKEEFYVPIALFNPTFIVNNQ